MSTENKVKKSSDAIRVMVVDDSAVIRGLFAKLLDSDSDIEVVTTASTGAMAVNLLSRTGDNEIDVDVITLDIQMPEMDGLTALPKILALRKNVKVIMASTLTKESAEETMKALSLGAAECLAKPDTSSGREAMYIFSRDLLEKVKVLGRVARGDSTGARPSIVRDSGINSSVVAKKIIPDGEIKLRSKSLVRKPGVIAIGSSTGGPQALMKVFADLKGKKFNVPVFLTQHMPAQFTALLAKQLSEISGIECKEGVDGEEVRRGCVYVAPGNYHMVLKKKGENVFIHTNQDSPENFCRPSVDPMLRSIAESYGAERVLVVILTGMGSDGYHGSKEIADNGGTVIAQDEATSIVWGMPGVVATKGVCTVVVPLQKITESIIELAQGQIT